MIVFQFTDAQMDVLQACIAGRSIPSLQRARRSGRGAGTIWQTVDSLERLKLIEKQADYGVYKPTAAGIQMESIVSLRMLMATRTKR